MHKKKHESCFLFSHEPIELTSSVLWESFIPGDKKL